MLYSRSNSSTQHLFCLSAGLAAWGCHVQNWQANQAALTQAGIQGVYSIHAHGVSHVPGRGPAARAPSFAAR